MSARNGSLMMIKMGNRNTPETFFILGGLREAQLSVINQMIEDPAVGIEGWGNIRDGAGLQSARVEAAGVFTDSDSERCLREDAIGKTARNYRFIFRRGDSVSGLFFVRSYSQEGSSTGQEEYRVSLQSSGVLTYQTS